MGGVTSLAELQEAELQEKLQKLRLPVSTLEKFSELEFVDRVAVLVEADRLRHDDGKGGFTPTQLIESALAERDSNRADLLTELQMQHLYDTMLRAGLIEKRGEAATPEALYAMADRAVESLITHQKSSGLTEATADPLRPDRGHRK